MSRFKNGMIFGAMSLLLLSGCASARRGPFLGLKADDPPQLSPYQQSITQDGPSVTVPYQAARPQDPLGTRLGTPETVPDSANGSAPPEPYPRAPQRIRQRPESNDLLSPTPEATEPPTELGLPEPIEAIDNALVLTISKPDDVRVSEAATFEITIRNSLPTAAEDVVIECRFGEGLSFPGSDERALRQQIGTLGVAEVRTIDLSLIAEQVGTHCVEFFVTAADLDETTEQQCVECVEPTVMIDLVGPTVRTVGGRLECVLTLVNGTGGEVSGIVAAITHDGTLVPREASAGAIRLPGRLEWDLGLLRADERVQMQVEFACPTMSEQTCITAEVTGRDMPPLERELCAVIQPRRTLDVTVADARDPLPVGETTTYLVTVTNRGLEILSDIRLDVEVDGGLEIVRAGDSQSSVSVGPGAQSAPLSATIPIAGPIAPDDSRTVQIDVRAVRVGRGGLRVTATETATNNHVTTDEPTVINPPLFDLPFDDLGGRTLP